MNIIKISVKFNKNIKPGRNVFHFSRLSYKVNHGLVKRLGGFVNIKLQNPFFDGYDEATHPVYSHIVRIVPQGYGWH
jgi:hypothetical protein